MVPSKYSTWNRFGIFVTVNGPFHLAINLSALSWGRIATIIFSPTEKGFSLWLAFWPNTRLSFRLISCKSHFSCFTYPSLSSDREVIGVKEISEGRLGLRPNNISLAETPVLS